MHDKVLGSLLALIIVTAISPVAAQERAVTLDGDTVILKPDGSWLLLENYKPAANFANPKNPGTAVTKPEKATDYVSEAPKRYVLWYNEEIWQKIRSKQVNRQADVALKMIDRPAYATVIYERLQVPMDELPDAHFTNVKRMAVNAQQLSKGYRVVNGDTMATSKVKASPNETKSNFVYRSYYYSNEQGSLQLHVFTSRRFYPELKAKLEGLLNGLVIND